jgi:hypothetical protein
MEKPRESGASLLFESPIFERSSGEAGAAASVPAAAPAASWSEVVTPAVAISFLLV